ncbi:putative ATP-dependent RNA helicase ucp12 [Batrachochytrium dendrobatidis]|nr:putative ATP-dependent RNA helicase ucp12 [Batrachochytrium dendrobatidis]
MPPKIIRAPSAAATDNSKQSKSSKSKVSKESDSKNADSAPPMTAKQQLYGTSWTGKTPLNLLHEHCQKQGWKKPILQCRKDSSSGSWIGSVKLAKMDKKTSQIREIYWKTSEKYESEQEARHASAYTLLTRILSYP